MVATFFTFTFGIFFMGFLFLAGNDLMLGVSRAHLFAMAGSFAHIHLSCALDANGTGYFFDFPP